MHKIMATFCMVFGLSLTAMAAIVSITAQQRVPQDGEMDITVTFSGTSNDVANAACTFAATNSTTHAALNVTHITAIDGATGCGSTWVRKFVWDVAADVGAVKIDDIAFTVAEEIPLGGVQLWKGGPYWAECNVGATKPEEYGYYFWWGDTVGYKRQGGTLSGSTYSGVTWVSSSGVRMSSSPFSENRCPTCNKSNSQLIQSGYIDSKGILVAEHDAATAYLGTSWRMPTGMEFSELISNCDTEWTTRNGVYGRLVKGRGTYMSKSIFLPAVGDVSDYVLNDPGSYGSYWSSTPLEGSSYSREGASYLRVKSNAFDLLRPWRFHGRAVRPLRGITTSSAVTTHFPLDCSVHVTGVTAQQRNPWDGKVDIAVTFTGTSNYVANAACTFVATNNATMTTLSVAHMAAVEGAAWNGTMWQRRFVWDAAADVGEVKIDDVGLTVAVEIPLGGVQLWENGPYWAECNVGASKPEEHGYYFWWGDTVGYKRNARNTSNDGWGSVVNGTSFSFSSGNCPTYGKDNPTLQSLGYIDLTGTLVAAHDAATVYLGTPWRMPTDAEFSALTNNCTTTWITTNGVSGRLVMGKGAYSSKSIFLPAVGIGSESDLYLSGTYGYYWSTTPYSEYSGGASGLNFDSCCFDLSNDDRFLGRSVRPLRESSKSSVATTHFLFDGLAAAKTAAKEAIDAALGENPSAAAQALADAAKEAIDKAETVADVTTAQEAGIADIAEQLAADELAAAKAEAKEAIDEALGENPSAVAQALADMAKAVIDAAETVAGVTTAQEAGIVAIAAQLTADELAAAKTAAKEAIDAVLGGNPSAAAQALAEAAKAAIDVAETVADVTTAQEAGVSDIAEQLVADELAATKTAAKQAIDEALGGNPSAVVQALAEAAKEAIDKAETVTDVTTAQEAGIADITEQLAADELAAAKTAAKEAIDAALGENPSVAAQALADAAKQAIDTAETVADVTTAQEAGVANIAVQLAADELVAAKTAAKEAIDAVLGENPSAAAQALADAAKEAINTAETVADVTTAQEAGVADISEQQGKEQLGLEVFEDAAIVVDEGSNIVIRVRGGNSDWASSVQVGVTYNTAAAADLDLKNATTNGVVVKNFKFPITLNWAKGEIGEQTIEIPVVVDKMVEADEMLTLQLANPMNATIAGGLCTVWIHDPQYDALKEKVASGTATKAETDALAKADKVFAGKVYVRGIANDATCGKVSGSALTAIGKTVTLKATANKGYVFSGWYVDDGRAARPLAAENGGQGLPALPGDENGGQGLPALPISRETSMKVVASNDVTYVAQFITPEEDMLELGEFLSTEFSVGEAVSIEVPVKSVSLPTVTVSGLPTGLKYYAKETVVKATKTTPGYTIPANTIYGTPTKATTKPANVSVTVKNLGSYQIVRKYEVSVVAAASAPSFAKVVSDAAPYYAISVDVNNDFAGKVTGAGVVQAGKKVTLKATANKGYVFSGWYEGDGFVTQTASWAFTMPSNDVAAVAQFVSTTEDAASIVASVNDSDSLQPGVAFVTNVMAGVYLAWPITAQALSLPTVAVSGLPSGLKFTAKDILDSKTKRVTVPANTIYGAPTAASKLDKYGNVVPSQVKLTVTTAGKSKREHYLALTVDAMPAWAVGTFNGSSYAKVMEGASNDEVIPNGQAALTIAATGKTSGKLLAEGLTWTLAAPYFNSYDYDQEIFTATLIGTSGKQAFTNMLELSATGAVCGESFAAWQTQWTAEPWKTVAKPFGKASALDLGDGVTIKFASSGAVTVSGSFVTGKDAKGKDVIYKASGSATLVPRSMPDSGTNAFTADVFLYLPPKPGKFEGYARVVTLMWNGSAFEVAP